jgi:uncharacterized membrane protein
MAFNYLSGSVNLFNLIFTQILKISPSLISHYTSLQDQVLYLIFIPSIIILFFVWTFGYWIVGNANKGFRLLISLASYIYIVYSGWYGSFIIPIILAWFPIVLISFFAFFIMTRIFHPMNVQGASKVMTAAYEKATSRSKEISTMEKQIEEVDKKIRQLKSMEGRVSGNDRAMAELVSKEAQLEHIKIELKNKLERLGG